MTILIAKTMLEAAFIGAIMFAPLFAPKKLRQTVNRSFERFGF